MSPLQPLYNIILRPGFTSRKESKLAKTLEDYSAILQKAKTVSDHFPELICLSDVDKISYYSSYEKSQKEEQKNLFFAALHFSDSF